MVKVSDGGEEEAPERERTIRRCERARWRRSWTDLGGEGRKRLGRFSVGAVVVALDGDGVALGGGGGEEGLPAALGLRER